MKPIPLPNAEWMPIDLAFHAVNNVLGNDGVSIDALNRLRLARCRFGRWFDEPEPMVGAKITMIHPSRFDADTGRLIGDKSINELWVIGKDGEVDWNHSYFVSGADLFVAFPSLSPRPLSKVQKIAAALLELNREGKLLNVKEAALCKLLTERLLFKVVPSTLKRGKVLADLSKKKRTTKPAVRPRGA